MPKTQLRLARHSPASCFPLVGQGQNAAARFCLTEVHRNGGQEPGVISPQTLLANLRCVCPAAEESPRT